MTNVQWLKIVERLRKYREIKLPDGDLLILWDDGKVSLRDGADGHCIICADNLDRIKRLYVDCNKKEG